MNTLWPLKRSSSATILSKTTVTTCLTVAAAVLLVMLSLVKCRRKHSTMAWAWNKYWRIRSERGVLKVLLFNISVSWHSVMDGRWETVVVHLDFEFIHTLESTSSCTTVLVVSRTRTVCRSFSSSKPFSISCHNMLMMFPAAACHVHTNTAELYQIFSILLIVYRCTRAHTCIRAA